MTKARRRDFELQSSELWGNKNDLSAQLQIQLIGVETKMVPFFLLKISTIHKKYVFRTFWGLSGGGDTIGSTKDCTRLSNYKMKVYMTKIIQKLGYYVSNLYFVGKRISEHGFFEFG